MTCKYSYSFQIDTPPKFASAMRAEKKDKGYIFAFSFSKPAYEEVARCKQEDNIEIELCPVLDLMNADPSPSIL